MKKIKIELEGLTPLLMNNPQALMDKALNKNKTIRKTTDNYDYEKDCEKLAYRMKSGELYIPSTAIMGSLIGAASWKKIGKYAVKPILAAAVRVDPIEQIPLGTKEYTIDMRTVVIQRARVVKARPRLDKWTAKFNIIYNEILIPEVEVIKETLKEAGERVGILDFRPQRMGPFGTFKIKKFQVVGGK